MLGTIILVVAACAIVALFVWMKIKEKKRDRQRSQ